MTVTEALARLRIIPDYDAGDGPGPHVHTFRSTAIALLGAHWSLEQIKASIERYGIEESGPQATTLKHGLVIIDDRGPVFLETL